jgi:hypothetical protein
MKNDGIRLVNPRANAFADRPIYLKRSLGVDVCAFSQLTPCPGTLTWFERLKRGRIFSFDWDKYDQGHLVFSQPDLSPEQISAGYKADYRRFYRLPSMMRRFLCTGARNKFYWAACNFFFRKGVVQQIEYPARPPVMQERMDWQTLALKSSYRPYLLN